MDKLLKLFINNDYTHFVSLFKKKIHFVVHLLIILINNLGRHVSTGPVMISFVSLELNSSNWKQKW